MEAHVQVYSYSITTGPQTSDYMTICGGCVCVCGIYSTMQTQQESSYTFYKVQTLSNINWSGRIALKHMFIHVSI